jgi:hypothetical protein
MYVGGVLRSEVDMASLRPYGLRDNGGNGENGVTYNPGRGNCNWCQEGGLNFDHEYTICRAEEWPMGWVPIGSSCTENYPHANDRVDIYNVLMQFQDLPYPEIDRLGFPIETLHIEEGDAHFHALPPTVYNEGVLLVSQLNVACPFSVGARVRFSTTITFNGAYYRHDPRIVLLQNTIESPSNPGSTVDDGRMRTCPIRSTDATRQRSDIGAPKTFLNEDTCIIGRGCSPDEYADTSFELNEYTLRQFFQSGNNFVYAIDKLPLSDENPCLDTARWRSLGGPCAGRNTTLDDSTRTILAEAVRSSTDKNRIVKDVLVGENLERWSDQQSLRAECNAGPVDSNGAVIDVDGVCWEHTHIHQLNVYDFTLWSQAHGGNVKATGYNPIAQVAHDGLAILNFPDWHPISRWDSSANKDFRDIDLPIGKLGQNLTFADLPPNIQSAGFAQAMGIDVVPAQGPPAVEICGSPGEVANDPALGAHFYFGKERYSRFAPLTQFELLYSYMLQDGEERQVIKGSA